jgi:hypothetical protein
MLILLQPGIQPLGQFDIDDQDVASVVGGEVAAFVALELTDGYAVDSFRPGPKVQLDLGEASAARPVWGLVDEGSSAGLGGRGYGTMFGQIIGATVGQGTGIGAMSTSGAVVVGPSTIRGSGKATLWTKPGLYGVTQDAWLATDYDGAVLNDKVYGDDDASATRGRLTVTAANVGDDHVAYFLRSASDTSFVSTPAYYAGATTTTSEHCVLYLVGCA